MKYIMILDNNNAFACLFLRSLPMIFLEMVDMFWSVFQSASLTFAFLFVLYIFGLYFLTFLQWKYTSTQIWYMWDDSIVIFERTFPFKASGKGVGFFFFFSFFYFLCTFSISDCAVTSWQKEMRLNPVRMLSSSNCFLVCATNFTAQNNTFFDARTPVRESLWNSHETNLTLAHVWWAIFIIIYFFLLKMSQADGDGAGKHASDILWKMFLRHYESKIISSSVTLAGFVLQQGLVPPSRVLIQLSIFVKTAVFSLSSCPHTPLVESRVSSFFTLRTVSTDMAIINIYM